MGLKDIMFSKKIQPQKVTYYVIPFMSESWKAKFIVMENRLVIVRGQRYGG